MLGDGTHAIEEPHGPGGLLHRNRFRIALIIAIVEAVAVWATHGVHITTIIVLGAIAFVCLMLYRFTTDRTRSAVLHQLTWLIAASQLGATILVAAGYVLIGALIILIVIFALVALGLLLLERR